MLLALLTFCYAAGIYSSEDVEWDCRNNFAVGCLCANRHPDQDSIRRFRRANRPWIEECLARVYDRACGAEPADEDAGRKFARAKLGLAVMIDTAMSD